VSRGGSRYGAGRPGWHAKTDDIPQIDVRKLQRDGRLSGYHSITSRWTNGATAGLQTTAHAVTLTYRYHFREGWRDIHQEVRLARTPCHLGGSRPWFICPRCSRRAATIYLHGWPACRKCSRLVYQSQSDDAIDRSWSRTYRIMKRLGQANEGCYAVPRRLNGMRKKTFDLLWDRWCREEQLRDEAIAQFATRLSIMLGDERSR